MAHDAPKKTHRRIKTFDLYDSETSNDGQEQTELECEASLEKLATTTVNPRESLFIKNSLNSFHRFYDDVSFTDCMAALDDRLSSRDMTVSGVLSEYCSDVQLLSCRRLYKTHSEMRTDILSSEYVCVPITTQGMPRIEDDQGQETSSTRSVRIDHTNGDNSSKYFEGGNRLMLWLITSLFNSSAWSLLSIRAITEIYGGGTFFVTPITHNNIFPRAHALCAYVKEAFRWFFFFLHM